MRESLLLLAALALGTRAAGQAAGATLSNEERALVQHVDAENARSIALLQRIVDINSGTMNFAGVRRVADVLRVELDSLGFTTRWIDGASFHRAGHLVAEHGGPGPKLLLIGHLDTVFEPSSPFQRFERLDDSTARGPGVIDMKGGDVVIISALRALRAVGVLARLNVTVVFHGDEEDAGTPLSEARRALIDAAHGATSAIGFEDGSGAPREVDDFADFPVVQTLLQRDDQSRGDVVLVEASERLATDVAQVFTTKLAKSTK